MARRFKRYWFVLAAVLAVLAMAVACASDGPEPTATPEPTVTPEPTATPVPAFDLAALDIDALELDALGLTEADLQCLAVEIEAEIVEQLLDDDLTAADALSVLPALQACGVDLARLIETADDLLAESVGEGYPGLDSLPFTAEQITCLVLIIDAELLEDLVRGEATQTAIAPVLEAFSACGIGLADLLAIAGGVDFGSDADDELSDDIPLELPQLLPGALDELDITGIVDTSDLSDLAADLPFTAEQLECLAAEIEIDTIQALAAGEVSPLTALSFISILNDCDVNLADLAN